MTTLEGTAKLVSPELAKALLPITVSSESEGIVMLVNAEQPLNALLSILVISFGIVKLVSMVQFETNALGRMVSAVPASMVKDVNCGL